MEPVVPTESVHEAALDINQVLGLKPQIETSWPDRRIYDALKAVGELIEVTDDLQENTWVALATLGFLKPSVLQELQAKHPEYNIPIGTRIPTEGEGESTIAPEVTKGVTETTPEVKAPKSTTAGKLATEPKAGSARGKREYAGLVERLIEEGIHTQKDIVNAVLREHPALKADSVRTFVSDSKNPKYTTFSRKVIMDSESKLRFEG
jgi:hypothetical protein